MKRYPYQRIDSRNRGKVYYWIQGTDHLHKVQKQRPIYKINRKDINENLNKFHTR